MNPKPPSRFRKFLHRLWAQLCIAVASAEGWKEARRETKKDFSIRFRF